MEKNSMHKLTPAKTITLAIVLSALVFGILYLNGSLHKQDSALTAQRKEALQENKKDFDKKTEYKIRAEKAGTAADLLLDYAKDNNIEVRYKDYGPGMGIFVQSIGGVPEDINARTDKWWQFWVNGKYSNKGASSVELKKGDEIIWRFAPSNY